MASSPTATIPDLPLIHHQMPAVDLGGIDIRAQRSSHPERPDEPDKILLCVTAWGAPGAPVAGSFTTYLTPAQIVQLANTMLIEVERAAINISPMCAEVGV